MNDEHTVDLNGEPMGPASSAATGGATVRFVSRPADPAPLGGPTTAANGEPSEGPDTHPADEVVRPDPGVPAGSGTWLLRAGLVASTVGLCLVLFGVYVYWFSALEQHRAQRALLNQFTSASRAQILSSRVPAPGRPAAVLTIPAIGLSQVAVEGTTATDLLGGPGLMPGTARPGSLGNSVIAGHRTIAGAPFARLDDLVAGDRMTVVTGLGLYRYRVVAVGRARPGAEDPTSPSRHPRLTLVTSGGPADSNGRTYVVAALVSVPNRAPVPRHRPTSVELGLSGDPQAVVPSILWGLALAAAFGATFAAYWRFRGRHWAVYVLSTPILLAVTFLWYENLVRLLPGTM